MSTLRWKLLLPGVTGIKKLFSLYMIGAFFNMILPGIVGGDAVKGFYLYKATGRGATALASIFMDRYFGFTALIMLGMIAYPFGFGYFHGSRIEWLLPIVVLSFFLGSFVIFSLRLGKRIRILSDFYNYFYEYRNQRGIIAKVILLSVVVQMSGIIAVYILTRGLGQNPPFVAYMIFLPLIVLFTTLPISISGIGVREGAFVFFLGLLGIKPEVAAAISFSWFIAMITGGLIGLVEYIRYKKEVIPMD